MCGSALSATGFDPRNSFFQAFVYQFSFSRGLLLQNNLAVWSILWISPLQDKIVNELRVISSGSMLSQACVVIKGCYAVHAMTCVYCIFLNTLWCLRNNPPPTSPFSHSIQIISTLYIHCISCRVPCLRPQEDQEENISGSGWHRLKASQVNLSLKMRRTSCMVPVENTLQPEGLNSKRPVVLTLLLMKTPEWLVLVGEYHNGRATVPLSTWHWVGWLLLCKRLETLWESGFQPCLRQTSWSLQGCTTTSQHGPKGAQRTDPCG